MHNCDKYINNTTIGVIVAYIVDYMLREVFGEFFINQSVFLWIIVIYTCVFLVFNIFKNKKIFSGFDMILITIIFILIVFSIIGQGMSYFLDNIHIIQNSFIWFYLLFFFFRCNFYNSKYVKIGILAILFSSLVLTSISMLLFISETILQYSMPFKSWSGLLINGRLSGVFSNPNQLGQIALLATASSVVLIAMEKSEFKKIIYLICLLLNTIVLFLTDSRSCILAVAIIAMFIIYFYQKRVVIKNRSIKLFILFIICMLLIFILYKVMGIERFDLNRFSIDFDDFVNKITSYRWDIWKEVIYLSKNNLLLGNGFGKLMENANLYIGQQSVIYSFKITMAHNTFLDIFYSSGLVGLIAFIIFNVKLFKDGFLICYKPSDILDVIYSGVMVALFSISMLDFGVLYSGLISPMFWIFCGLIIGNAQKKQLSKNEVKS